MPKGRKKILSPAQEETICRRYLKGATLKDLAAKYGVSGLTIRRTTESIPEADRVRRKATYADHRRRSPKVFIRAQYELYLASKGKKGMSTRKLAQNLRLPLKFVKEAIRLEYSVDPTPPNLVQELNGCIERYCFRNNLAASQLSFPQEYWTPEFIGVLRYFADAHLQVRFDPQRTSRKADIRSGKD